jgi:acyl-CoA synthetase (AMP-forming)/AMP-acid ligase II
VPLLERAGRVFSQTRIVSERSDDTTHRHTYGDFYQRARVLAAALQELGLRRGDRVATLMWNNYAHLEAYVSVSA